MTDSVGGGFNGPIDVWKCTSLPDNSVCNLRFLDILDGYLCHNPRYVRHHATCSTGVSSRAAIRSQDDDEPASLAYQ